MGSPDSEPSTAPTWLDVAHLDRTCDGDDMLARTLLELFLDQSGTELTALEAQLAAGDGDAVRKLAHSITGSALSVGALALATLCRRIEHTAAAPAATDVAALAEARTRTYEAIDQRLRRAA